MILSLKTTRPTWALVVFLTLCAGCQHFYLQPDLYESSAKPSSSGTITFNVKSRLEFKAIEQTDKLSKISCQDAGKQRVIKTKQATDYVPPSESTFATGYYHVTTTIRCK